MTDACQHVHVFKIFQHELGGKCFTPRVGKDSFLRV